jgi:ADP-heptose:LPS heptosyltransferase
MRLLVTRLKFLGDVVLSTPVLEALREHFPEARIDYLASAPHAQVLRGHPCVDHLFELPARPSIADMARMVARLREGPAIDWAFDLWSGPRSAILVRLSGARQRVGLNRGVRARLFQHRREDPTEHPSAIRCHLDRLVPLLGQMPEARAPRLGRDAGRTATILRRHDLEERAFTLVHPGSTWPDKAWPRERWPVLIERMDRSRFGDPVIVTPPGEEETARWIASEASCRRVPVLQIPEIMDLLPAARSFVGNDGGVLHMAVAYRVPSVGLFGPTDPRIWFPYEDLGPYRVVTGCGPEEFDARGNKLSRLGPIEVETVAAALDEVTAPAREGAG